MLYPEVIRLRQLLDLLMKENTPKSNKSKKKNTGQHNVTHVSCVPVWIHRVCTQALGYTCSALVGTQGLGLHNCSAWCYPSPGDYQDCSGWWLPKALGLQPLFKAWWLPNSWDYHHCSGWWFTKVRDYQDWVQAWCYQSLGINTRGWLVPKALGLPIVQVVLPSPGITHIVQVGGYPGLGITPLFSWCTKSWDYTLSGCVPVWDTTCQVVYQVWDYTMSSCVTQP